MWFAFPDIKREICLDGLYALVDGPLSYAIDHFSEYCALLQAVAAAELDLMSPPNDAVRKNYELFDDYLCTIDSYFGIQGMRAAAAELYADPTDPKLLLEQINHGISGFLNSGIMTCKRQDAIAGIQRNSKILKKTQEERAYLIARARQILSVRQLSIIAGYTYAAVHLAAYHHFDWNADAADKLQKAYLALAIDKEIDCKITLVDSVL